MIRCKVCRDKNRCAGVELGAPDRRGDRGCDSASGQRRPGADQGKTPRRIYGGLARAQEPASRRSPRMRRWAPRRNFFCESREPGKWGPASPAPGWRRGPKLASAGKGGISGYEVQKGNKRRLSATQERELRGAGETGRVPRRWIGVGTGSRGARLGTGTSVVEAWGAVQPCISRFRCSQRIVP